MATTTQRDRPPGILGQPPTPRSLKRVITGFVLLIVISIVLTVAFIRYVIQAWLNAAELARATGEPSPSFDWPVMTIASFLFVVLITGLSIIFTYYIIEVRNNAQQTRFMAGITHELKSPLSAIQLYAQSLQIAEVGEEERRRFLRGIVDDVRRLDRLVSNITETGKFDLGVTDLRLEEIDAAELLERYEERVRDRLAFADRPIEVAWDAGERRVIRVDTRRIEQVLDNLVDNAVKYSDSGEPIRFASAVDGGDLVITCVDAGLGLEPRELDRIFDRFYRSPSAKKRPGGGTGLGLFISRRIVEAHGGSLEGASAGVGKGSTFTIRIPSDPSSSPGDGAALESRGGESVGAA